MNTQKNDRNAVKSTEKMRVYCIDGYIFIASPTLTEAIALYEAEVVGRHLTEDELHRIRDVNLDFECTWNAKAVSKDELFLIEKGELSTYDPDSLSLPKLGDICYYAGYYCKYITFRQAVNQRDVDTYIVAYLG